MMTRSKFVREYLEASTLPTTATRRYTEQDKYKLVGDVSIDFHADRKTEQQ